MTNEVDDTLDALEALDRFETTGSTVALQYLVVSVAGATIGKPERLLMLETIKGRLNNIYEKRQGNVPQAIGSLISAIDDFTGSYRSPVKVGSYKFTLKVKNPP